MKKFTLFMANINDALLTKDVGLIPFIMEKYHGYESSILSLNKEEDLPSKKKYLENLKITITKDENKINSELKNTDVLMIIGIYEHNLKAIQLYKNLNPNGKIYLKLDASSFWSLNINKNITPEELNILSQCSLISVESRRLQTLLNFIWRLNIQYIPNGYYNFINNDIVKYEDKKNTILFAGRIGSPDKQNEILLEAFKNIEDKIPNWNIKLAGNVEEPFLIYLNNYFKQNRNLKERIILTGKQDKENLKKIYEEAKVFCLTSHSEACANVLSESVSNGCYLISTDVDGAIDIIDYGLYGSIIPIYDIEKLQETLLRICLDDELLKANCKESQIYCKNNLSWIKICENIDRLIYKN